MKISANALRWLLFFLFILSGFMLYRFNIVKPMALCASLLAALLMILIFSWIPRRFFLIKMMIVPMASAFVCMAALSLFYIMTPAGSVILITKEGFTTRNSIILAADVGASAFPAVRPIGRALTKSIRSTKTFKKIDSLSGAAKRDRSSDNAKGALRSPKPSSIIPAKELEVGNYRDLSKRSVGDGMTPDHIPSHAANRAGLERKLGRKLTKEEDQALRDNGVAMMIDTKSHQKVSQTYGGRNTPGRIEEDGSNPLKAIVDNVEAYRDELKSRGYTDAQVDAALEKVINMNESIGRVAQ